MKYMQSNCSEFKQMPFNHLPVQSHYFNLKVCPNRTCEVVARTLCL